MEGYPSGDAPSVAESAAATKVGNCEIKHLMMVSRGLDNQNDSKIKCGWVLLKASNWSLNYKVSR